MKPILLTSLAALLLGAGGCGTTAPGRAPAAADAVSLAALGPAGSAGSPGSRDAFYFGAGDALGHQIFTVYVASLELDRHYATGASDFPAE